MTETLDSHTKIFADDTKAFRDVRTEEDAQVLQTDVDRLFKWSTDWQLNFNPSKCSHMTYGKKQFDSSYTMLSKDGSRVPITKDNPTEKDLGVTFDRSLTFRQHIGQIVSKVRRTFHHMDARIFC